MSVWAPAKSCSSPQPCKTSKDAFTFGVTPGTIPQFVIPSLDIQEDQRLFSRKKMVGWRSHAWHSLDEGQRDRKARRSHSDPIGRHSRGSISCAAEVTSWLEDNPDPVARSVLSLPHLPKITTPYGFVTLGERPQVAHEESLFSQLQVTSLKCSDSQQVCTNVNTNRRPCQTRAQQLLIEPEDHSLPCQNFATKDMGEKTPSNSNKDPQLSRPWPPRLQVVRRSASPLRTNKGPGVLENSVLPERKEAPSTSKDTFYRRSNSFPKINSRKPTRNLFQTLMKKHFTNLKTMKSSNLSKH